MTTTWAKFGESQTGAAELAQSWIWATVESPAALFAQIAGAAAHYLTVPYSDGATQRNTFTTMLQTKQKAIKALQHEVDLFHRRHWSHSSKMTAGNIISGRTVPHYLDVLRFIQAAPVQIMVFVKFYRSASDPGGNKHAKNARYVHTWVVPLGSVDETRIDGVNPGESMQYTVDETAGAGVSALALCFVDEELQKTYDFVFVLEQLRTNVSMLHSRLKKRRIIPLDRHSQDTLAGWTCLEDARER